MKLNEALDILNEAGLKTKKPVDEEKVILNKLKEWNDKYTFAVKALPTKVRVYAQARGAYIEDEDDLMFTELRFFWKKKEGIAYCEETDAEDDWIDGPVAFALFIDTALDENHRF